MLVGRRTNLDITTAIDFDTDWQKNMRAAAEKDGVLAAETLIDYFLFPSNRLKDIPALRIGRPGIDNILLYWARKKEKMDLIEATADVEVVHQNHDYAYFPGGQPAMYSGKDRDINFALGGGSYRHLFSIAECNLKLKNGVLMRKHGIRYYASKRYIFDILPVMHPFFTFVIPLQSFIRNFKRR